MEEEIIELKNDLKIIIREESNTLFVASSHPEFGEWPLLRGQIMRNKLIVSNVYEIMIPDPEKRFVEIDLAIDKSLKKRGVTEIVASTHHRFANFLVNRRGFDLVKSGEEEKRIRRSVGSVPKNLRNRRR